MQEGSRALGEGAASRQRQDRAYFLDLMGDSLSGLGRYEAAIEAYQQAAQALEAQGARCSYALCLFKIADSYLSLREPWHAIGHLEACLPLLRELGMVRHVSLAQRELAVCQAGLAQAGLLGESGQVSGIAAGQGVNSRYARYRRPAELADRRGTTGLASYGSAEPAAPAPA
jgi:tetratricopeptide (TPR) repeat protein